MATKPTHGMPRERTLDSSIALLRDPYGFISKRCDEFGADAFATRLLLRRTICMRGKEAARVFYDPQRFMRSGAAPLRLQKTLFGRGGVQSQDGQVHADRKALLLSTMTPESISRLTALVDEEQGLAARKWSVMHRLVLYDELQELLTRAVCRWSGVPLPDGEVRRRTKDLADMFDRAGAVGPSHWSSRMARRRSERWIGGLVDSIRAGRFAPPAGSPLERVACAKQSDGALLESHAAAVEVLNLLRPTVAVSVYMVFIAHALHAHPGERLKLQRADDEYLTAFVQEVRRFYPFFPATTARVRQAFEWRGYRFPEKTRVLLDLYGTNHDPREWPDPDEFRPERFLSWNGDPFDFIPQGGGDHRTGHRCPGEWITIELMKCATRFFTRRVSYQLPEQDLRIDRSRLPALPRSKFVIEDVRIIELERRDGPAEVQGTMRVDKSM